jgi:hypothetical protein
LLREHNVENLQAYFEAKQLSDYLVTSHKQARFDLDLLRKHDQDIEQYLEDLSVTDDEDFPESPCEFLPKDIQAQQRSSSLRKHFAGERDSTKKIVQRIDKFIAKYIGKNATNEVNVPARTQQEFIDTFEKFKQNIGTTCGQLINDNSQTIIEKKEVIVTGMEERMQMIESMLEKFRNEILINLTDPCKYNFHQLT